MAQNLSLFAYYCDVMLTLPAVCANPTIFISSCTTATNSHLLTMSIEAFPYPRISCLRLAYDHKLPLAIGHLLLCTCVGNERFLSTGANTITHRVVMRSTDVALIRLLQTVLTSWGKVSQYSYTTKAMIVKLETLRHRKAI